jgi:hypothetical protein
MNRNKNNNQERKRGYDSKHHKWIIFNQEDNFSRDGPQVPGLFSWNLFQSACDQTTSIFNTFISSDTTCT